LVSQSFQQKYALATKQAKDLTFKAKTKYSQFVLEDISRPRTKAKDNNTEFNSWVCIDRIYRLPD